MPPAARSVVVLLLLAALGGCAGSGGPRSVSATRPPVEAGGPAPVGRSPAQAPLEILRDWDVARAGAWEHGDVAALRALYLRGSVAGARDVRALAAYVDRGLRVTGLTLQRLTARVLARTPRLVRIEVVERFAGATVVGGARHRRLPTGAPTRRVVELRYVAGAWRMSQVRSATR